MTTTLVIDDETAKKLERAALAEGLTFADMIGQALRFGLERLETNPRYRTPVHDFGSHIEDPKAALVRLEDQDVILQFGSRP